MSTRVSPVERIRADIDDLFASDRDLGEVLEEVARLGVRLLMQTAIEAEVTEFLGRERSAHGERARAGAAQRHEENPPVVRPTPRGPKVGQCSRQARMSWRSVRRSSVARAPRTAGRCPSRCLLAASSSSSELPRPRLTRAAGGPGRPV